MSGKIVKIEKTLYELLKYYFLNDEECKGQFNEIKKRIEAELLIMEYEENEQGKDN